MCNRISVKVTFEDGNFLQTEINGTFEDAKKYYLNNVFNIGNGGEDYSVKCINVEEI